MYDVVYCSECGEPRYKGKGTTCSVYSHGESANADPPDGKAPIVVIPAYKPLTWWRVVWAIVAAQAIFAFIGAVVWSILR